MDLNPDIVFAHTHCAYPTYTDYHRLVELAEFETIQTYEVDFTRENCVYVHSPHNGEWKPHWENHKAGPHNCLTVLWCLERPGKEGILGFCQGCKKILNDGWFDYIWLSDRYLAGMAEDSRIRFVPLGSHAGLGTLEKDEKFRYDICHYSAPTPRRSNILGPLATNVKIAPLGYDPQRHRDLMSSKFMLNVHQDDWPIVEPLRFALAAAYGIPIISEWVEDAYPYNRIGENHYFRRERYGELVNKMMEYVVPRFYDEFRAMGLRCHDLMTTEFEFGRQVRLAVQDIVKEISGEPTVIR